MKKKMMACGLAFLVAVAAGAATAEEVAAGTRVRLTGPRLGAQTGTLLLMDAEAVTLRTRNGKVVRMPSAEVRRLEVSRRPSRRGRNAFIGMAAGAASGFILGAATNSDGCTPSPLHPCLFGTDPWFSDEESGLLAAVPGALLGALVGSMTGGEKWESVSDARVRVGVAPSRGGAAAAVTVRF
jgi:hypothetical protein